MRNWSIVTKIVVLACSSVSVLLIIGCLILIRFEIYRENVFTDQYIQEIQHSIILRGQEEKALLVKNVTFNTDILSRVVSSFLFDFDIEKVNRLLPPYLQYPEILAIQVFDEHDNPVSAAWKTPQIDIGQEIPKALDLERATFLQVDSLRDDEKVGKIHIYYSDAALQDKIHANKTEAAAREVAFRKASQSRLQRTIAGQIIGVCVILTVLIGTLSFFLRGLIQKPLRKIARVAHQLSNFDLTVRLKAHTRDEIGMLFRAINDMVHSFTQTLSLVQQSSHQVLSSATQLAVSSEQHERTMTTQVDSTTRAAQSMDDISIITGQLVQTIQQVSAMVYEAAQFASQGQSDLFRMEEAMRDMENSSVSISEKLKIINTKADRITDVVTTINKVSEQTNLLSLNASIEAEKAGEYGRGFSVVAREIRRLADQTAVSTLDIERMVKEMQSAVASGVMEMDKFIQDVQHSTEDVGRISMQLTLIIDQVQALSPNFENVSIAVGQQSEDAQEISTLMKSLSEEVLQTRQALGESFEAIDQLKDAAKGLQEEVSKFQVQ